MIKQINKLEKLDKIIITGGMVACLIMSIVFIAISYHQVGTIYNLKLQLNQTNTTRYEEGMETWNAIVFQHMYFNEDFIWIDENKTIQKINLEELCEL